MSMRSLQRTLAVWFVFVVAVVAHADIPREINYQGYVVNAGGTPVNGTVSMTFRLYDLAGTLLWNEVQNVTVTNGIYHVALGSAEPFPNSLLFDVPVALGVRVGADPEMTPRQPLRTAPYSFRALEANALVSTATVAGSQVTGLIQGSQINGTITLATVPVGNVTGGVGMVTSVATGTGLTGGPISTAGTISVAPSGIGAAQLAPSSVDVSKLNTVSVDSRYFKQGGNTAASDLTFGVLGTGNLDVVAKGARVVRYEYPLPESPNVIAGHGANIAGGGQVVRGIVVAGGGSAASPNRAGSDYSVVSGGLANNIGADRSVIGGGQGNQVNGTGGVVAGGILNIAGGFNGAVGGGTGNKATGGDASVVAGGEINQSTGSHASVGGGYNNVASGSAATIPGGADNAATGETSFAAGRRAKARGHGCFVWADTSSGDFACTNTDQFLVRSRNGVAINSTDPLLAQLHVAGPGESLGVSRYEILASSNNSTQMALKSTSTNGKVWTIQSTDGTSGGGLGGSFQIIDRSAGFARMRIDIDGTTRNKDGVWATLSDARLKKNIESLEQPLDTFLGLRGRRFEYVDPASAMSEPGPRIGFIAQEVQAAVPQWVRADRSGMLSVIPTGFDALAVEAVRELKARHEVELERLSSHIERLSVQLARLERLVVERR